MTYISKGLELKGSTDDKKQIRCFKGVKGIDGVKTRLWQRGRKDFATVYTPIEERALEELKKDGLIEFTERRDMRARYFLLMRCLICLSPKQLIRLPLSIYDKQVYNWIRKAVYRLNVAEIIYLMEYEVKPSKELLNPEDGGMKLHNTIHRVGMEYGRQFEMEMSIARCRDKVVQSVIRLMHEKRIYFL